MIKTNTMKKLPLKSLDSFPPRLKTLFILLISKNMLNAYCKKLRPIPASSELDSIFARLDAEWKLVQSYRKPKLIDSKLSK